MKRDAMKYPFTENYPTLTQKEKLTLAVVADLCLCSHPHDGESSQAETNKQHSWRFATPPERKVFVEGKWDHLHAD